MKFIKLQCNTFRPDPKPEPTPKKKKKEIPKVSKKRIPLNAEYTFNRKEFLLLPENRMCFVEGCKRKANTIEHVKGRKGFADEQARKENIPLLLDERFWKPCCLQHNLEFETNPELSKKYQQSQIHKGNKI